ncbi:peroxisomal sarcosine oxidase [Elysia marginata]|uniref:Peroxisomal sarcosine oxidase n=1 Tax=Elysia marginata TaxID=1093978 RepID=A0AAV4F3C7_9GAST|nr:peroxisomal sarcosine oxidase [Elysia marginata]
MASSKAVYDVIVIGAGIEGSSSAYNLVKDGKKFPLPHTRGSSHGQSRITRYAYDFDFYVRMMVDAFPMWATLAQEAGEDFFLNAGVLDIRSSVQSANKVVRALSTYDIPHELLTAKELRKRFPALTLQDTDLGVYDPSGGILMADRALAAFQKVFKQLGGTLHDNEAVISVKPGSPAKVVTSRAVYAASSVVIAAGAWAGRFASALGLRLPLQPLYWSVKPGQEADHHWSNFPCFIDSRGEEMGGFHCYGLPCLEYPGLFKIAQLVVASLRGQEVAVPTNPDHRDRLDEDDAWVEEQVLKLVKRTFLGVEPKPAIKELCMYTNTPDSHPIIDRHPQHRNIIIAAGFSGHGFKLAPAVGKLITEMVSGKPLSYNVKSFSIGRFDSPAKL